MRLFRILRLLFRSRNDVKETDRLLKVLGHRYFPQYDHFGQALKEVGETSLYIGYETKSIEKEVEEVRNKLEDLEYEIKTVQKSFNRFKSRNKIV